MQIANSKDSLTCQIRKGEKAILLLHASKILLFK